MKDHLIRTIKQFLKTHFIPGKPVLLGFSGGNDSMALLDLLNYCRTFFPIELHLAHIDHGWRRESKQQAQELKKYSKTLNVTFHLHTSRKKEKSEDKARIERLVFFQKLYKELEPQALILAHHADDQAETILKRIFEGSHFTSLGAMKKVSEYEGMVVWRPLLHIPKEELIEWCTKRNLKAIQDETNFDERYLRAKMRKQIFPELNRLFGKEIRGNLLHLSDSSHELQHYLQRKTESLFSTVVHKPTEICWDLKPFFPLEMLEVEFALKKLSQNHKIALDRNSIKLIVEHIARLSTKRRFGKKIIVDRGIIQINL